MIIVFEYGMMQINMENVMQDIKITVLDHL